MNALAQNPLFWGGLIAGLLFLYVLPSVIGATQGRGQSAGLSSSTSSPRASEGWPLWSWHSRSRAASPVAYQRVYYPGAPGQRW
jgi:hypothetical protein